MGIVQMQLYSRELEDGSYLPVDFERDLLAGDQCGAWDGVDEYLLGEEVCDYAAAETSNFNFMFPKSVQTPDPNADDALLQISEGEQRNVRTVNCVCCLCVTFFSLTYSCCHLTVAQWWFEVDPEMYQIAKEATANLTLKRESDGSVLPYTPGVVAGGNGVSGPTFVDNAEYRQYVFEEFDAVCLDMESAATAHIAFQNNIPFLFFRSLSDLAGADQDGNILTVFFTVAAENAFAVTLAFIEAMYPDGEDAMDMDNEAEEEREEGIEVPPEETSTSGGTTVRMFGPGAFSFLVLYGPIKF